MCVCLCVKTHKKSKTIKGREEKQDKKSKTKRKRQKRAIKMTLLLGGKKLKTAILMHNYYSEFL